MKLIYIAAKFSARSRLRYFRDVIHEQKLGTVISSWLDDDAPADDPGTDCLLDHVNRDLRDLRHADLVILDTYDESTTGGREFEAGFAFGANALARYLYDDPPEIEVWRVGPSRNVFHQLMPAFAEWDDVLDALRKEAHDSAD